MGITFGKLYELNVDWNGNTDLLVFAEDKDKMIKAREAMFKFSEREVKWFGTESVRIYGTWDFKDED
jgi:hypothetical protein